MSSAGNNFTDVSASGSSSNRSSFSLSHPEQAQTKTTTPAAPAAPPADHYSRQQHLDPLSRTYPKPDGEIDVKEALSRTPRKWTLGHWVKHAKDVKLPPPVSSEESERRLEESKLTMRLLHADVAKACSRQAKKDNDQKRPDTK